MTKDLVIVWEDTKGEVAICETDTLQDVRALILKEFDDDMLPFGDFFFHVNDIRISAKQECKKQAWNLSTISLHSKHKRQGTKRKVESEDDTPAAASTSACASIAPMDRSSDDIKWDVKYNQLKQVRDQTGGGELKKGHLKDHGLICWFRKQRNLIKHNKLLPSRQERLKKLGINLSYAKKVVNKVNEEKWDSQLEKLRVYHCRKGHFNVPIHWQEDLTLGIWVYNQRRLYVQTKSGERDMNPERIRKLEQIGFDWTCRPMTQATIALKGNLSEGKHSAKRVKEVKATVQETTNVAGDAEGEVKEKALAMQESVQELTETVQKQAERVKDQAKATVQETANHGKKVAGDTQEEVKEKARAMQETIQEPTETVQSKAERVEEQVKATVQETANCGKVAGDAQEEVKEKARAMQETVHEQTENVEKQVQEKIEEAKELIQEKVDEAKSDL